MSTFTRSFTGYAPPPRYDVGAKPFSKARIQESPPTGDPEWTTLETVTLDPVDADPANPGPRNFTTNLATLEVAIYRLVWEDEEAVGFEGGEILYPPTPAWAPSVGEVAGYIRARTKASGGKEIGTFTPATRPTALEVERLIAQGCREVSSAIVAEPCSANLRADAKAAAAMYTAMLIESGYYPEQSQATGSTFKNLESLWKPKIASLKADVAANCVGEGEDEETAPLPAGGFDDGELLYGRDYPPAGDW